MTAHARRRVCVPTKRWTPVPNQIFEEMLAQLEQKRSALVYLVLYDRCWHRHNHTIVATVAEIAAWCGMDERPLTKCIEELEQKQFIVRKREGVKHSHINKPCWRIPLLDQFGFSDGHWTPIPRFIITKYCRRFPGAVLLPLLLYYQSFDWGNKCWVGVPKLCKRTGWSESRVRDALRTMGHELLWRKQSTKLPWPLEIMYNRNKTRRRFRVLAVWYEIKGRKGHKLHSMTISGEFRKRFGVKTTLVRDATLAP